MYKIPLDPETERALAESGIRELRPPGLQAVVLIRRALGLPVPREGANNAEKSDPIPAVASNA
jgi:hypothetical protein